MARFRYFAMYVCTGSVRTYIAKRRSSLIYGILLVPKMVCTPSRGQRNKSTKKYLNLSSNNDHAFPSVSKRQGYAGDVSCCSNGYNCESFFSTIRETLSIITLTLQDAPKSFHRAIVNAAANTRHTLYHASIN